MKKMSSEKLSHRIMASFMSFLMVLSLIPLSSIQVWATTDGQELFHISIKDESGKNISGAQVKYTIHITSEGENEYSNTVTTDENGQIRVMNSPEFEGKELSVSAVITKDGYQMNDTDILYESIMMEGQGLSATLTEITITCVNTTYDEEEKEWEAVTVFGYDEERDTVLYKLEGDEQWSKEVPKLKNAGEYPVYVKIERDGIAYYESGENEYIATIDKGTFEINVEAYEGTFDKEEHPIINVKDSGIRETDTITLTMTYTDGNGTEISQEFNKISEVKIIDAGTYEISLKVHRDGNYKDVSCQCKAVIQKAEVEEDGISVIWNNGDYNGTEQELVKKIEGIEDGDKVEYQIVEEQIDDSKWSENVPKRKDAKNYLVAVRINRGSNYKPKVISETVTIKQAEWDMKFNQDREIITYEGKKENNDSYDFSASVTSPDAPDSLQITYRLENGSKEEDIEKENKKIEDIVEIDETTGILTVKSGEAIGGYNIIVVAEVEKGDTNHKATTIEKGVVIKNAESDLIRFELQEIPYIVNGDTNIISQQTAQRKYADDNGQITYSAKSKNFDLELQDIGVSINLKNGKLEVKVDDYEKLGLAIEKNNIDGNLAIEVTASKECGTKYHRLLEKEAEVYNTCTASYTVKISFAKLPENAYTIYDTNNINGKPLEAPNGENDWYNTPITIKPTEDYNISESCNPDQFKKNDKNVVDILQQGENIEKKIYLMNSKTQEITKPCVIVLKMDTKKPYDLKMEYQGIKTKELEYPDKNSSMTFHFFQSYATIKVTAYDDTSGVESFSWKYSPLEASDSNLKALEGTVQAIRDEKEANKYAATLIVPQKPEVGGQLEQLLQLKGCISVKAVDKAGNESSGITGDGIVVDTISPTGSVTYQLKDNKGSRQTDGTKQYFSNDVECTFHITEANFFPEDVEISVLRNGTAIQNQKFQWKKISEEKDEYETTIILSQEGDYIVSMKYEDCSGNKMQDYQSEIIVVDKTDPVISFSYEDYKNKTEPQTAIITIKEKNFRQSDICVKTSAKNISGNTVVVKDLQKYLRSCTWTSEGDVHTAKISQQFADAIYELTLDYSDLALRPAKQIKTSAFIVDRTAPSTSTMSVIYSTSVKDTILSNVTFGYYNPSVTITFTAYDITSGIDYFTWSYERQKGVSKSNTAQYSNMKVKAVQDKGNKAKYTASVTLPKSKANQLRGNIKFTATDKYNNTSRKITDTNHVIVVDTVAPTITAEYTDADKVAGGKRYYTQAVTATFTVKEANFYSQDIVVKISKNGGKEKKVRLSWSEISKDVYVGTYKIKAPSDHSGDGDYIVKVTYTDRSNNKMKKYTSKSLVIDTTSPVVNVSYSDNNPNVTLQDTEGNRREYYHVTRKATITVKERNFNAKDVGISITAKDMEGNLLDVQPLIRQSKWKSKKDVHTMTITYEGNANYTFHITCKDLANNKASDYTKDYFTIDDEHPDSLSVAYSTSVLDTILSNISFGFYDAKTTVTITAKDSISGVHSFEYSYTNAAEAGTNNEEMVNQVIEESGIQYSDKGVTAVTTFEIPKEDLEESSQFNGTVNFNVTDRAGNQSDYLYDTKRIVVDNISPTATVEYSKPVQKENGISYYDGDITVTVTVNEANFYSEDMIVSVMKNSEEYSVTPTWTDNSADMHIGTFTLKDDGNYFVTISYTDKSNNSMKEYISEQLTIDTQIEEPIIRINGEEADRKAFKEEVIPEVSFEDVNYESYAISLTRTRNGDKDVEVKDKFIAEHITVNETGGFGTFDTFDEVRDNDGIYTMKVSVFDKAGHTKEKTATFTVNRFGSVYEYSSNLVELIQDGGAYVPEVETNFWIKEYNADHLVSDSLNIEISKDGKPLETPVYSSTDMSDTNQTGESGWYEYQYDIYKDNFNADGVYKITVSSKDKTGNTSENVPENTNYTNNSVLFYVDSTKPEIDSITGLEHQIVNAASVDVNYTAYDTIGLESIAVYVNGEEVNKITDFSGDKNNYSGEFTLSENPLTQSVSLVVTDLAGNITNTDAEDFSSAYSFHKRVTVSTSFFIRLYANKILFWGIIGGFIAAMASTVVLIVLIRKRARRNV